MTPAQFIATWQSNALTERAGAQAHFDDLCTLLGVAKPRDPENYCFERGAKKAGGGDGWADVWKRGHFAWENKKPGRDLGKALKQLTDYALHLENPPLLVVCDRERIVIHTAFTGYPDEPREIRIEQLADEGQRQILRWVFTDPHKLRPEKSTAAVTEEAARRFAALAQAMRERGQGADQVAHFLVQSLFCMFAEDEGLLPQGIFTSLLAHTKADPAKAAQRIATLFAAMQAPHGSYGNDDIAWFNGGLFQHIALPELIGADLATLHAAAADMDWRAIDPTIFGTLFERGLGDKRAALGAHYTDTGTIAKLITPLVRAPLLAAWAQVRANIAAAKTPKARQKHYQGFLLQLTDFRVLDPACGSGNFLYLALKALRDVEKQAQVEAQELGLQAEIGLATGAHNILGLEVNEFAAELARVTVWIGDIQWCRHNGWPHGVNPILKPLDGIAHRDALLNADGSEALWPQADVIVGNPPFIGGNAMRGELGDAYVETLRKTYEGRVPGGADLVCYWFEKARAQIEAGQLRAAALVSTQSVRNGANRKVLERIADTSRIFLAWSDEPWVNDGAAVRVSMTGFGDFPGAMLDGAEVEAINPDLTAGGASGLDATHAARLPANRETAFQGTKKVGSFDVDLPTALSWLTQPNPNGQPNAAVVKPSWNGLDVTRRPRDAWIVDFGTSMGEAEAALYELPFGHVVQHVKPERILNRRESRAKYWWRHGDAQPSMRNAIKDLPRYIVTPEVAKHRIFVWAHAKLSPDCKLMVIARADDATFGILHSRFHELWSLRMGSMHGVGNDPRYTPSTTFETFPFPAGFAPRDTRSGPPATPEAQAIAAAAQHLHTLRENWLNPPPWVDWLRTSEEEQAGFPARPVAKPGHEAELKKRTLTNLYNARAEGKAAWLAHAHEALDKAVAAAYGWADYTPQWTDDDILRRLLALNLKRSQTKPSCTTTADTAPPKEPAPTKTPTGASAAKKQARPTKPPASN